MVYRFTSPLDGVDPEFAGLVPGPGATLLGATLLGTTRSGGASRTCSDGGTGGAIGCGTVFQITP